MINVCCSTCQSIGINIQETSSEMRDYNGRLLFFVLKCCCVNKQVLIWWTELHCLPSLRLAFSSLLKCSPVCTNPKLPPRNSEAPFVPVVEAWDLFFPLPMGCSWECHSNLLSVPSSLCSAFCSAGHERVVGWSCHWPQMDPSHSVVWLVYQCHVLSCQIKHKA